MTGKKKSSRDLGKSRPKNAIKKNDSSKKKSEERVARTLSRKRSLDFEEDASTLENESKKIKIIKRQNLRKTEMTKFELSSLNAVKKLHQSQLNFHDLFDTYKEVKESSPAHQAKIIKPPHFTKFYSFMECMELSLASPDSAMNDFTRLSGTALLRILTLILKDSTDLIFPYDFNYHHTFKTGLLSVTMNYVFYLANKMIASASTKSKKRLFNGLLPKERNEDHVCNHKYRVFQYSIEKQIESNLPSEKLLWTCLFHFFYLNLGKKPKNLKAVVEALNSENSDIPYLYCMTITKTMLKDLNVSIFRFLYDVADNLRKIDRGKYMECSDELDEKFELNWEFFKTNFDSRSYEFRHTSKLIEESNVNSKDSFYNRSEIPVFWRDRNCTVFDSQEDYAGQELSLSQGFYSKVANLKLNDSSSQSLMDYCYEQY